jgi:hypothetical protein
LIFRMKTFLEGIIGRLEIRAFAIFDRKQRTETTGCINWKKYYDFNQVNFIEAAIYCLILRISMSIYRWLQKITFVLASGKSRDNGGPSRGCLGRVTGCPGGFSS